MNIVILNGNQEVENTEFDRYIQGYQLKLQKTGHYVKTFQLREMSIDRHNAPEDSFPHGRKVFHPDDVKYILNILKETDLLVWASPLKQGLISVLTKMVQNRVNQHLQDNYPLRKAKWADTGSLNRIPLTGVIVQPESDTAPQEILLNRLAQERMAANLNTVLSFFITTELPLTDAACTTFRSFDYRLFIEDTCNDFLTLKASLG